MITILRKHHRWLMIIIAILAIPFIFYFNKSDLGAARMTDLGRIYNRTITLTEFSRNARLMNLARGLGLTLGSDLMINNVQNENDMYAEFTWNRLTLRHEAEQLGIRPTPNEITDFVKTLTRFKGDAGFDLKKYTDFTADTLPSLGLNDAQIEELISDQLTLNRVKALVGAGVQPSESESKDEYQRAYGKMEVAVVKMREKDFEKDVKISDEDISKYYEAHKAELKSEEKRRVEFITVALTDAEKKLTGKERVEPLQRVADRANDFTQALLEKDAKFADVAAKFQTPVVSTEEFTLAAPDPKLVVNPQLNSHAFQLTLQAPFSDPIQGPDGFSIVHLLAVTESHPLTLEEAKPKIVDTLKTERLHELISTKGMALAQQLREGVKAKTPLEKVAEQGGVKLERMPAFSLLDATTLAPDTDKEKEKLKPETVKEAKPDDAKVAAPKEADPKSKKAKNKKAKDEKQPDQTPVEEKLADEKSPDEKATDAKLAQTEAADPKLAKVEGESAAEAKKKAKPKEDPTLTAIKNAVFAMNQGDVSDFIPTDKGGMVAVLEKRVPADPEGYAIAKTQYETQFLLQGRTRAFVEWLRDRRKAAGVTLGPG